MVDFKQDSNKSYFTFKDETPYLANAIRRIILDEVPTFAIEDVEFVRNDSAIYEEALAHRLGLVPIKTDLIAYNLKDECSCGGIGCALCEVKMTISQDEEGYVRSSSIKSDDPQIVPADDQIIITKLLPGKTFQANLKAVLGKGKEHAKWSPAHTYLKENNGGLDLVIEPYGQLDSKEIYNKAVDILISKIALLDKLL